MDFLTLARKYQDHMIKDLQDLIAIPSLFTIVVMKHFPRISYIVKLHTLSRSYDQRLTGLPFLH
jgi:hypothetical protein